MSANPKLGPFVLADEVWPGGMGNVYAAHHEKTGQPVALKVLDADQIWDRERRLWYRREIQALAKLHHPAISAVLDYGEVSESVARDAPEAVCAGAPWFAMEFIDGPPLHQAAGEWGWPEFEAFLKTTLDALAHAHARSIVHRDLKPENILVETTEGGEPSIHLVDFGIARLFDIEASGEGDRPERIVGTPKYMAPEQILGQWRDQGPWTDLYALGCLTWRLICGRAPYTGDTNEEILEQHLDGTPSGFDPNISVPAGLETWLRALLADDHERRTRRAADARWALAQLGPPEGAGPSTPPASPETERTGGLRPTLTGLENGAAPQPTRDIDADQQPPHGAPDASERRATDALLPEPHSAPPMVANWRRGASVGTAAIVPRAGLELFAMREIPVVDREPERSTLWDALRDVHEAGAPRVVTLEGGPGTGKTRLAEWLCRRSREVGAARVLRASHPRGAKPWEGLRGMFQRRYRTVDLGRAEVHERLERRLGSLEGDDTMRHADARALTEFLRPTGEGEEVEGPRYQFANPGQRAGLVRRLFRRNAVDRPVVAWFDDLHWGGKSMDVLAQLFSEPRDDIPLLVVATLRSDVVAEREDVRERLDEIRDRDETTRLGIDELSSEDHRRLIDRLLDLDSDFADRLAERTEGNPMFAIQLLQDWADRELLEATDSGFRIPEDASFDVSDNIHELWLERLRRVVDDSGTTPRSKVWEVLELAALLGREVEEHEWRAVCGHVGLERGDALRDMLIERGLAGQRSDGWAFAHGLLVDTIERRVRESGHWADRHRTCARILEDLDGEAGLRRAERRADHWVEADAFEPAIEALLEAGEAARQHGDSERALTILRRRGELLDRIDADETDPRRIENDLEILGRRHEVGAERDDILAGLQEVRDRAESAGADGLLARAWSSTSLVERREGRFDEAIDCARRAASRAEKADDDRRRALALAEWGWGALQAGNLEAAERRGREAHRCASKVGYAQVQLHAQWLLATIEMTRGNDEASRELFETLLEECRRTGNRKFETAATNGLGELARFGGDAEAARRYYAEFRRASREVHRSNNVAVADLNLAQVEVMAGCWERSARKLRQAKRKFEATGTFGDLSDLLELTDLARAAGCEEWGRVDELLRRYVDGWPDEGRLIKDYPWIVEIAGEYAADAGASGRAEQIWELACELWEQLGDEEEAERIRRKME